MLTPKEIRAKRNLFSETDKNMAAAFKVFSDVNRYRIFRILADKPKISITNIAKILNISLSLVSQHVKILVHANILQKERSGKNVFPKIEFSNPFVRAVAKTIQLTLNIR